MFLISEVSASSPAVLMCSGMLLACFVACCIAITVIDIRMRRIPNSILLILLAAAAVQIVLSSVLGLPVLTALGSPFERIVWAVMLLLVCVLAETLWRRTHHGSHGMGFGDIKLAAVGALWIGGFILLALLCACGVAVIIALIRRHRSFAFGPYLSTSLFLSLLIRLFGS